MNTITTPGLNRKNCSACFARMPAKKIAARTAAGFIFTALFSLSLYAQTAVPYSKGNGLFCFQFANVYFEIDSTIGGRISSLKVDSQEVLFVNRSYPSGSYWGSTLWLSPQDGRHSPLEVDWYPYSGGIVGTNIVLMSLNAQAPPVKVIKNIGADTADTSITISYRIVNLSALPLFRSAWEVTRVLPPGSLTFWPTGDTLWGALSFRVETNGAFSWYQFLSSDPTTGMKFFADSKEGWYGHVTGQKVLFIKKYSDVPRSQQAPHEAENEFWLMGDHAYIELENQSAYTQIAVNDTLVYQVKWYLRKLPSEVTVAVGSQSLIDYARKVSRTENAPVANPAPLFRAGKAAASSFTTPLHVYNLRGVCVGRINGGRQSTPPSPPAGVYFIGGNSPGVKRILLLP